MQVSYDFDDSIFKKDKRYARLAREHLSIAELKSDRIKWRVIETATRLNIPTKYEVDFYIKSIIGIKPDNTPIYDNKHTIEVTFPAGFPRKENIKARAVSNIWHPNIKWSDPLKGRICVNNQSFGRGYDLFWLVLRIGEIIQYKNYLAENIPPYPEDATVAKWVLDYGEPNNYMNIKEMKAVDDSNLLEYTEPVKPLKKIHIKSISKSGNMKIKKVDRKNRNDN